MRRFSLTALASAIALIACTDKGVEHKVEAQADPRVSTVERARLDSIRNDSIERARIVHVPRPEIVRGLYVNRWAALGKKMGQLIDLAKKT